VLRVISAGALTLVEDAGRFGVAHLGVGRSGAADSAASAAANAAVGNPANAAALETLLDGLTLAALQPCMVAIAGTGSPVVPTPLEVGQSVTVAGGESGLRRYLAVRGGVDAAVFLGSRSTDLLAGIGAPLQAGDVVGIAGEETTFPETVADPPLPGANGTTVRVYPGPRADWCEPDALVVSAWTVTASSDRTGVRLEGAPIARTITDELPPEGLLPGAVQVPPSGQPIVFLYDHPVTGGYPVIGVVHPDDLRLVAQTRPGRTIRFVPA
jgi:biotin-dependent carboxylase-like uncharacterized protein